MAIDERARHELHRRLEEFLGADEAATLMAHLPPVGWADVVTKHDLAQLEERINLRFQAMEDRFDGKLDKLEGRLYQRMADFAATYARTTVISVVASVVSVGGLVFAACLV
jgi:hypothetical protein